MHPRGESLLQLCRDAGLAAPCGGRAAALSFSASRGTEANATRGADSDAGSAPTQPVAVGREPGS